jgi:hypothetical protein
LGGDGGCFSLSFGLVKAEQFGSRGGSSIGVPV